MTKLSVSNLAALVNLVECEIHSNDSADEVYANDAYLYALLGKLTVLKTEAEVAETLG